MAKGKTIRLYRAEEKPGVVGTFPGGFPEWIKQSPEYQRGQQAGGRWFTDDLGEAKWYIEHEYPLGKIVFVDVPRTIAERYRVSQLKKEGGKMIAENPFAFSNRPEKEYFLPREISDKKQELRTKESGLVNMTNVFILSIIGGIALILNSFNTTGYVVTNITETTPKLIGLVLIIVGLVGIFLNLRNHKF